jgi:hypothetical protein
MAAQPVAVTATMKVAQITRPGAGFEVVEREGPQAVCGTRPDQSAGLRCLSQ